MSNALKSILKFVTLKEQNDDLTEYSVDTGNTYSEYTEYNETCDASDYP